MPPRGKVLLFALFFLFASGACLPAAAGMHFADGVEVDGGGGDGGAGGYDELPLNYGDMNRYDQIAMEPYRDSYDELPVDEKARLYGKQFEYMRGREPNFDPAALNPAARGAEESDDAEYEEVEERQTGGRVAVDDAEYDQLPMWFDDMGKYDQIAMEPYRDKYDAMPVGQKARVYGPQFEFMRGRKPNFHPDVMAQMDQLETAETADGPVSSFEAKQYLYKPVQPKKRRPGISASQEELLGALSGPWEKAPPAEVADSEPDRSAGPQPAGRRRPDRRMESLREGWNAADVLRGARER